jgi:hypothetical protein
MSVRLSHVPGIFVGIETRIPVSPLLVEFVDWSTETQRITWASPQTISRI